MEIKHQIQSLIERKNQFENLTDFEVGDIVRWKHGMKNKSLPQYNQLGIVLEILREPIINPNIDPSSAYYNEKLNLQIGFIEDDEFVVFLHDSRRFEKYTG